MMIDSGRTHTEITTEIKITTERERLTMIEDWYTDSPIYIDQ